MTYLDHQQIPVTGPVGQRVWETARARIVVTVRDTAICSGVQVAVDPTPACCTSIVPEVVVVAEVAAAAEVTQAAVMYPVVIPYHLLQVFKWGFLLREFSNR